MPSQPEPLLLVLAGALNAFHDEMEAQRPPAVTGSVWRLEAGRTGFLPEMITTVLQSLAAALIWLHDAVFVPARAHLLSIDAIAALIGLVGDATDAIGELARDPSWLGLEQVPAPLAAAGGALDTGADLLKKVEGVVEDLIPSPEQVDAVTTALRRLLTGRLTAPPGPPGLFTELLTQLAL
jgi:hypothetical protein